MQPFYVKEEKEALRLFQHNVNSIPLWHDNASDYSLYHIGMFNEDTGMTTTEGTDQEGNRTVHYYKMASGTSVRKEQ